MGGVKRPWTFQGGDVQVKTEFDRDEISFLAAVTGALAEGARRGLLLGEATHPDSSRAPFGIKIGMRFLTAVPAPAGPAWTAEVRWMRLTCCSSFPVAAG